MKRHLSTCCIAAVLGLASIGAASAQQTFNLRFAHYLPQGPFLDVEEGFTKRVEERTGGNVKISIAYSGALGGGNEVLGLTGRGAVDMTAVVPGYYPDQLLYWKTSQIPFVFDSPRQAIEVVTTAAKELPAFNEEMDRLGVRFLFQQPLGSFYLTGAGPDCDTLAGLQGKKVRAFGADIPRVVSAAGATPVTIQVVEIYEALQRRTLDYSFLNLGNIAANRLPEVAKTTCGPVMSIGGHMVLINKRTWDRLPAEYQAIITEEAEKAQEEYYTWLEQNDAETSKILEGQGHTVKAIQPEELATWRKNAPDLLQGWVEDMTKRGQGETATAVAQRYRELMKQ